MTATNPDDWGLPQTDKPIVLSQGELLLCDWIICGASRLIPEAGLLELGNWTTLRLGLWQAIATNAESRPLALDGSDARTLLALCPTTFRWGVGDDVGFSLKMKLARFIAPELFHDDENQAQGDSAAPGAATKDAGV